MEQPFVVSVKQLEKRHPAVRYDAKKEGFDVFKFLSVIDGLLFDNSIYGFKKHCVSEIIEIHDISHKRFMTIRPGDYVVFDGVEGNLGSFRVMSEKEFISRYES